MKLLAVDTSNERLCLALCLADGRGGVSVHGHEEAGGAHTSQRLLPAAQSLLMRHGLVWRDLDGLGFGQGPGAFTGLRGTCSAIQGLALGLGLRAVAIPSLRIVAEDARRQAVDAGLLRGDEPCAVRVAVDARMGQVYAGAGAWDGQGWQPLAGPAVRDPGEVAQDWLEGLEAGGLLSNVPGLMAGSGLALMPDPMAVVLRDRSRGWFVQEADRAFALGHCAARAWQLGSSARLDAAQVMPLYVRDRVAQTTAERLQLASASELAPVERVPRTAASGAASHLGTPS